jgi:hypothetical protein
VSRDGLVVKVTGRVAGDDTKVGWDLGGLFAVFEAAVEPTSGSVSRGYMCVIMYRQRVA